MNNTANHSFTIAIGSDHAGIELRKIIGSHLEAMDHKINDVGCPTTERVDYPDYAIEVANQVASGKADLGVLVCGSGVGMSITANKIAGIRAALCTDAYTAEMTRAHNDSNILCIGQRVVGTGVALAIVDSFFSTDYEGGRHAARVDKISALEKL
jgi:ribose 5-phosphate isomerase B